MAQQVEEPAAANRGTLPVSRAVPSAIKRERSSLHIVALSEDTAEMLQKSSYSMWLGLESGPPSRRPR